MTREAKIVRRPTDGLFDGVADSHHTQYIGIPPQVVSNLLPRYWEAVYYGVTRRTPRDRIKLYCMHAKCTQAAIAKAVRMSPTEVSHVGNGRYKDDSKVVASLARHMGTTPEWLMHGAGQAPEWFNPQPVPASPAPPTTEQLLLDEMRSMKEMMQQCINTLQAENDELRGRLTRLETQNPNTGKDETNQRTA